METLRSHIVFIRVDLPDDGRPIIAIVAHFIGQVYSNGWLVDRDGPEGMTKVQGEREIAGIAGIAGGFIGGKKGGGKKGGKLTANRTFHFVH